MKKRYENAFFLVGIVVLAVMVAQLDFHQVWQGVTHAGYWFVAVLALWFFLYFFNAAAWWLIICRGARQKAPLSSWRDFLWLYKITISGFALNYATPGGLMGGEPYKIMVLAPRIGTERATSSVILHTMTHIFSHFWYWLISCALYVLTCSVSAFMAVFVALVTLFCLTAIWFFLKGYKHGIVVWGMRLITRLPLIGNKATRFMERHADQLADIDRQMALLHGENPRTLALAVLIELTCRIVSALEIYFILLVIMPSASYAECILILAFTTLIANMLFFIPLQLGGREGGFLMSVSGLGMTVSAGIFVALLVRLRELFWTGVGLLLIKLEKPAEKNKTISPR